MHLFGSIWARKEIPHTWHVARIAAIFKKGNSRDCANYRPIALLNASYKLFASILFNRLKAANVDQSLSPTQFGFRKGSSVNHALFMARRFIDCALVKKDGKLVALALDWSKAFDSIMLESMYFALSRLGVPHDFVSMIKAIYTSRAFFVQCSSHDSSRRVQYAGICQGCPLSPFLFIMVMDVLMKDARSILRGHIGDLADKVQVILWPDV